jgi:hypothetical protein
MPAKNVEVEEAILERALSSTTDVHVSVHHNLLDDGRHSALAYITYPEEDEAPVPIPNVGGWDIKNIELMHGQCAVTLLQQKEDA